MTEKIKKIAILTSGGDSPGMNNVIRAVVKHALARGLEPYIIYDGYKGLVENNIVKATSNLVDKYIAVGGTFIYTARYVQFKDLAVREIAVKNLKALGINALVIVGGDGSYMGAKRLTEMGINCIGIPGTIDNDISSSESTVGFDTALNTVVEAIDKIRETAESHRRCIIVETMGNKFGDLAVFAAIACGAEFVVSNERPEPVQRIVDAVQKAKDNKKHSIIVIVSENIYGKNGLPSLNEIAKIITAKTEIETRVSILGYLQRGGTPTAMERVRATQMGIYAVDLLIKNISGHVIGNIGEKIVDYEIMESFNIPKKLRANLIDISNEMNVK